MTAIRLRSTLLIIALFALPHTVFAGESYLQRSVVRAYLDEVSRDTGLDRNRLAGLFARLKPQKQILDAIAKPAERTLTWREYRPIFIKQKRIDLGRQFLVEHRDVLERATQVYGVPGNIIAAIIGVETYYGEVTGKYRVLESLATLAFDYPPRSIFFKRELTEFLRLSEAEGLPAGTLLGSYAGAMGVPQFIASSYRQYAVDFDGDGKRDLFNSMADVVGSVGNYLARNGWVSEGPVASPWPINGKTPKSVQALVRTSLKPAVSGITIAQLGFSAPSLAEGTQQQRLLSVMTLQGEKGEEVWVGYRNFYVITRYNHSRLYAMAVFQLAESLGQSIE